MGKKYEQYFLCRGCFEEAPTPLKKIYLSNVFLYMNMHIDEIDKNAEVLGDKYVSFQGIKLIKELIEEYGLDVVIAYMTHIQVTTVVSLKRYILVTNWIKFINKHK